MEQAAKADELAREQAEKAEQVQREQAEQAEQAKRDEEKAAKAAERGCQAGQGAGARAVRGLTKAELADKAGRRDLPKSGTVEELIERLVDADNQ